MRRHLLALTSILVPLLTPAISQAQSSQPIVMECSSGNWATRSVVTLDLTNKTAAEEIIAPNPGVSPDPVVMTFQKGTVTQISDGQIAFVIVQGAENETNVLNRYTGYRSVTNPRATTEWRCLKQQKQF